MRPANAYGTAKRAAEEVVLAAPAGLVLRCSLVYGRPGAGRSNFFADTAGALARGEVVRAPHDQWTTPVLVDDVAAWVAALLHAGTAGVLHLGGPERLSRCDWARRIAAWLGVDQDLVVPVARATTRYACRPENTCLASARHVAALDGTAAPRRRCGDGLPAGDACRLSRRAAPRPSIWSSTRAARGRAWAWRATARCSSRARARPAIRTPAGPRRRRGSPRWSTTLWAARPAGVDAIDVALLGLSEAATPARLAPAAERMAPTVAALGGTRGVGRQRHRPARARRGDRRGRRGGVRHRHRVRRARPRRRVGAGVGAGVAADRRGRRDGHRPARPARGRARRRRPRRADRAERRGRGVVRRGEPRRALRRGPRHGAAQGGARRLRPVRPARGRRRRRGRRGGPARRGRGARARRAGGGGPGGRGRRSLRCCSADRCSSATNRCCGRGCSNGWTGAWRCGRCRRTRSSASRARRPACARRQGRSSRSRSPGGSPDVLSYVRDPGVRRLRSRIGLMRL